MSSKTSSHLIDRLEETVMAALLGIMVLVTFANVVARKVLNTNILWALEITVFLFGWLVLLGASYAVKKNAHLGVDVIINMCSQPVRRFLALFAVSTCIVFSLLLLKGAWDYWANFANLPATEGRWFPTGFQETYLAKGWYEVNDIPHPGILRWMEDVFNEGEAYEKLPRMIPYAILPLSMFLLLFRFLQVAVAVWQGHVSTIVASHEADDDLGETQNQELTT